MDVGLAGRPLLGEHADVPSAEVNGVDGIGVSAVSTSPIGCGRPIRCGVQLQLCTMWIRRPAALVAGWTVTDGGSPDQGRWGTSQRIRSAASASLGSVPTVVIRPA